MPTSNQVQNLLSKLKKYRKTYLKKQYSELDESATRIMVNSLLSDVFGYTALEEVKTEYSIRGEYADYIIQLDRKKHFVVEVKAIQIDLNEKHLRQSVNYAANEGIDWIILTNGKQIEVYKVLFGRPIDSRKIFDFNLSDEAEMKKSAEFLVYLTKKSVLKNELCDFWKRFEALEPAQLSKQLYDSEVVKFLKKVLKKKTNLSFSEDDIIDSIHKIITTKIESNKPRSASSSTKKRLGKSPAVEASHSELAEIVTSAE